jgi:hypothetical protein
MTPEERQAADEAFAALQNRVVTLEESLEKHREVLELLLSHKDFFAQLTTQLEARFVNIETNLLSLTELIGRDELTRILATHRDTMLATIRAMMNVSPSRSPAPSKPKFEAPATFSGKREDWKTFQSQLELFFLNAAPLYATDAEKIMFSISRLGDTAAFKYMEKHIPSFRLPAEERPVLLSNLDVYFKTMSKTFGVTNAHVLAESQLRTLKQRGSALDYTNKFINLAADTKWNDAAMISQYRLGLKESVQETMAIHDEPDTFADFSQLAIDIDNRHFGYSLTKSTATKSSIGRPSTTSTTSSRTTSSIPPASTPSMAMDLSQAQHRPIDAEEKQRRKDNNLCTYCASADHWIKDCPTKPKFSPRPFTKNTQSVAVAHATSDVSFDLGKYEA